MNDLNAADLSRLDQVCLAFEQRLKEGKRPSVDRWVTQFGGTHETWLRVELQAIVEELDKSQLDQASSPPAGLNASPVSPSVVQKGSLGVGNSHVTQFENQSHTDTNGGSSPTSQADPGSASFRLNEPPKADAIVGDQDIASGFEDAQIGPYEVLSRIGYGGMGEVYQARDSRLGRTVAIKTLLPKLARREELRRRFLRETQTVAAIKHPAIVEIHDVGVHQNLPYAVMEFLDGPGFDEVLAKGPMSGRDVVAAGIQIADALAAAHDGGVVHRDLKPQNLLLAESDRVESIKVLDFGLSRRLGSWAENEDPDTLDQTREGQILGTPGYMSPEQASGQPATAASDLFSLGCIMHEALYGSRAFGGDSYQKRIAATLNDLPPRVKPVRRKNLALAQVIEECLQKNPAERPPSAAEVADRLRNIRDAQSTLKIRRRSLVLAAAGGLALVGSVGLSSLNSNRLTPWAMAPVRSVAVLSFLSPDAKSLLANADDVFDPLAAVGKRPLTRGEEFSGLVTHELSRNRDLRVLAYRPVLASTPAEFKDLGDLFQVQTLLTGRIDRVDEKLPSSPFDVTIELINAADGTLLHSDQVQISKLSDPIEQRRVAHRIATLIGHELTPDTSADSTTDRGTALHCFVDGKIRADLDSTDGLERSLMCLELARKGDEDYLKPTAALALAAISLAGQSDGSRAVELIEQSRKAIDEVRQADFNMVDSRLAAAMLNWQQLGRFEEAYQELDELKMTHPNHWQVRHQLGLLLSTLKQHNEAQEQLRQASLLHPLSGRLRVDLARAHWFSGDADRARTDAMLLLKQMNCRQAQGSTSASTVNGEYCRPRTPETLEMVLGFLVDVHEQDRDWSKALSYDADLSGSALAEDLANVTDWNTYLSYRQTRLAKLPYAPIGSVVNELIHRARRDGDQIADADLAKYLSDGSLMMTMTLAIHPAMKPLQTLDRVAERIEPLASVAAKIGRQREG